MIIKQIRSTDGTGTLSYILSDQKSKAAAVIDPNINDVNKLLLTLEEMKAETKIIIDTHTHADHVSGAAELKKYFPQSKFYMHEETKNKFEILKHAAKFGIEDVLEANAKLKVDMYLNEGDEIKIGDIFLKILFTPGHTDNHISIVAEDAVFTGDLLLIGQAGRSDLPGGNPEDQYESLFKKIVTLPKDTKIYPGHDYEKNEFAYLKDELKSNPFLKKRSKKNYMEFVKDFFPPFAETASEGGKMTLQCGTKRVSQKDDKGLISISAKELSEMLEADESLFLLDVREPFELLRGKVEGVTNIPVRELPNRLEEIPSDKKIVTICASGNRSYEAAHFLLKKDYKNVLDLEGGTLGWFKGGYAEVKK